MAEFTTPLVYASVVQANSWLWQAGNQFNLGVVFVFATDDAHKNDLAWVKSTSKKIADLKSSSDLPEDNKKFIQTLRNDRSQFCFKLGESLSGGAEAWCATYVFSTQTMLPKTYLPTEGIVPILLKKPVRENANIDVQLIAPKYYI